MATLNLGRIKPVFRDAYDASTAYVVDDIVTSGNETFICILASTGNATSNATYWTKLAAKGTDGTDVGTTITTQGDLLYRDGSGLQRLAKPASNKYLQNTSGGVLSWETVSSDVVKVGSWDWSTNVASVTLSSVFSNDYDVYKCYFGNFTCASNERFQWRYLDSSDASHGNYDMVSQQAYTDEGSSENHSYADNMNQTHAQPAFENVGQTQERSIAGEITMFNPYKTSRKRWFTQKSIMRSSNGYTYAYETSGNNNDESNNFTKFDFSFASGGNITSGFIRILGYKH